MTDPPRSPFRRRTVRAAVAIAVVGLGAWWLAGALRTTDGAEWTAVARDDLVLGVEVTGTLRAVETSSLGPPPIAWISEYKIAMLAPEGEEVEEGTPVLAFDSSELQRQLQTYQAEAEGARTEIEKKEAEIALQRAQNTLLLAEADARFRKASLKVDVPSQLTSENDLRAAKLDLELARKEIAYVNQRLTDGEQAGRAALRALQGRKERAENRVAEMMAAIESMTVKAPRDGTVIYVTNWRDEKKKVGDSCWRGEKVVEIPSLDRMMADGEVDEADASKIAAGQKLSLRLDAHPDEEFTGNVSNIWGTVQRKSWRNPLKVVRLDIDLDRTDVRRMRPGMRFRGTVEIERLEDALVIPLDAVFPGDDGPTVYRKTLVGYDRVPVRLGRRNGNSVEVVDGLRDGDRVSLTAPESAAQGRA